MVVVCCELSHELYLLHFEFYNNVGQKELSIYRHAHAKTKMMVKNYLSIQCGRLTHYTQVNMVVLHISCQIVCKLKLSVLKKVNN